MRVGTDDRGRALTNEWRRPPPRSCTSAAACSSSSPSFLLLLLPACRHHHDHVTTAAATTTPSPPPSAPTRFLPPVPHSSSMPPSPRPQCFDDGDDSHHPCHHLHLLLTRHPHSSGVLAITRRPVIAMTAATYACLPPYSLLQVCRRWGLPRVYRGYGFPHTRARTGLPKPCPLRGYGYIPTRNFHGLPGNPRYTYYPRLF